MKTTAKVIAVRHQDAQIGQDEDRRVITLRLWAGGTLDLELKQHEATPYAIGRRVLVELTPERGRR